MRKTEIESRLRRAYEHATPDVSEAVRAACTTQKGAVIPMTATPKKPSTLKKVLAVAAALVLVAGAAAGIGLYRSANRIETTVSLDVNPALVLSVNKAEQVLAVTPKNDEARQVIGDMALTGNDLTLVVNALIGSMLREGYLDEAVNSILISVEDADHRRAAALQKKLADQVDGLLHTDTMDGAVLSQTVDTADTELATLAKQYGISAGKAQLIRQIVCQDSRHTFEELAGLSIHQLNLIRGGDTDSAPDGFTSTGTASDKDYIGVDAAKNAAVFDAIGDREPAVRWESVEMDYENGRMVYEVEFTVNGIEYDYAIDAKTGEIVEKSTDRDADRRPTATTVGSGAATTTAPAAGITAGQARAAALAHAGVTEADIRDYRCELDREDGVSVYEIEFSVERTEYAYHIDAATGKILDSDIDPDD